MDRLIYIDSYETIDSNLTDANVGARKERSVRDNMFVVNAVTNSVIWSLKTRTDRSHGRH